MMIFLRVQGGFLAVSIVSAFREGTSYPDMKRKKMAWVLRSFGSGIVASCSATPSLKAVNSRSVMETSIIRLFFDTRPLFPRCQSHIQLQNQSDTERENNYKINVQLNLVGDRYGED